jgi:methylenetetrahydrofolate reductase (NADPH)
MNPIPLSCEFFPPNTPVGSEKLKTVVADLAALEPEFFSVTYGAGGSTRDKTLASGTATAGEFRYAAELIAFIRETQGQDWRIEAAAYPEYHPQQRYAAKDLDHFAAKMKAGADAAITQFFFNPDAYFHFVDEARKRGVDQPIVAGIMPIHNYAKVAQFAARDGIEIPRWVTLKMEGYHDDAASVRAFGLEVVARLCERLVAGGAPAIHFYTLNQSALTLDLCRRLGWLKAPSAENR